MCALTAVTVYLARKTVKFPEEAPAEPAAADSPGSVHQGATLAKRPRPRISTASVCIPPRASHHANAPSLVRHPAHLCTHLCLRSCSQ